MTQSPLKVIALISGGKDSLFSILHCIENGHEVVALANLHPKLPSNGWDDDDEGEDMNSFMYQTVGHSIIPLYSECLGTPLYRREITGSAVQTGRYYDTSGEQKSFDETEDLALLLRDVLKEHPEANALCSGAILSTYQRTRVESVAGRLGLIPLAYLWQYPALPPPPGRQDSLTGLLEDMSAAGCDARIIKIASGGIKENLLWSNVADGKTRSRLVSGLRPFFTEHEFWLRGAVLGEGGEYETLAVNGPRPLWKKRIEVPKDISSTFYGEGGVSYRRLRKAKTVDNNTDSSPETSTTLQPRSLDEQFEAVLERVRAQASEMISTTDSEAKTVVLQGNHSANFDTDLLPLTRKLSPAHLTISNITAITTGVPSDDPGTAADQMRRMCEQLNSVLDSLSNTKEVPGKLTTSNIVSTTLLLKDMSQFAAVNSIYSSMFRPGEPNPPARVTISCQLPQDFEVSLSVILDLGPRDARRGLHVQSRSYWAPANIGPYSQAICVPIQQTSEKSVNVHDAGLLEMVHVAGQIPLVPQSMLLTDGDFAHAGVLSLQHLWRVGQEREVDIWPWGIAFLKQDPNAADGNATTALRIWEEAHRIGTRPRKASSRDDDGDDADDEGPDAWDLQFNRFQLANSAAENVALGQHLHVLPNNTVFGTRATTADVIPPFIAAEVTSLPRDAPVEWWSLGVANLTKMLDSSSAAAAATCGREEFEWGSVSRTSVHAESQKQSAARDSSTVQQQHLVTVLIRSTTGSGGKLGYGSQRVDDDLRAYLLRTVEDDVHVGPRPKLPPLLECVHGMVLLSTVEGQPQWAEVSRGELFNNLTVIPCTSVYGQGQVGTTTLGRPIDDASSSFEGVKSSVSLGLVGKPNTSVKDVTAVSATCQPLAVAITMRIDSTWRR